MLVTKRSAGVTPEMNIRERVTHTPPPSTNKAEPTLALNSEAISPEVQNRGISAYTKRTHVLQNFF